jgi:hypothetical protein
MSDSSGSFTSWNVEICCTQRLQEMHGSEIVWFASAYEVHHRTSVVFAAADLDVMAMFLSARSTEVCRQQEQS